MQRIQNASLAKTGKDCILREFEDKREGSNTVLVLKKTKTSSSCRTIFMTEALKEELKHWLHQLEMDKADMDGRYRNSGMFLRLPNGLAVEPVLIRKKFEKWQKPIQSFHTSCSTVCGIPARPINFCKSAAPLGSDDLNCKK